MSFSKVAPLGIGTEPGSTIRLGDSLLHSTGLDIGVGSGIGVTIRQHGDATFTGIVTASKFVGDMTVGSGSTGTFSSLTITGNLGVGGVVTYEDVTNVDSIGIITARSGIKIGPHAGVAATIFADGSINSTGIITATNVSVASSVTATTYYGDVSNLTGVQGVPSGAVMWYPAATPPSGFLKANGDTIPDGSGTVQGITADFSTLYAIVGATLPDLRGEFIRGFDDGKGTDSGRAIKSAQTSDNKEHNHVATSNAVSSSSSSVSDPGHSHQYQNRRTNINNDNDESNKSTSQTLSNSNTGNSTTGINVNTNTNTNVNTAIATAGGTESRPRNIALLAIIKI